MEELGLSAQTKAIYEIYKKESALLWFQLEQGKVTKDFLKTERFRRTFEAFALDVPARAASDVYLEILPQTVILLDYAVEICQHLSERAEVGIITNGIETVQKRRLQNSGLAPFISFIAVSEECGFAKPDVRFFEHSSKMARRFSKEKSLVIGDRLETDIQGAHDFGVDACFYNPARLSISSSHKPRYEISHLSQLHEVVGASLAEASLY